MSKNKKLTQFELYQFSVSNMGPKGGVKPSGKEWQNPLKQKKKTGFAPVNDLMVPTIGVEPTTY